MIGTLVGIAILCALGTWQVERLTWKNGLIAAIGERIHAAPQSLDAIERRFAETGDVDYWPVELRGRFLHEGERYFLSTFDGAAGWNVYTPLLTTDGRLVFVNRGFVPYEMRDPARRQDGQIEGEVTITGLARTAPTEKPGMFVPDNEPAQRTFFWRDVDAMAEGLDRPAGVRLVPFLVDQAKTDVPGGYPVGGTTVIDLPNDHLQYAVTWYGLAAGLAAVTAALLLKDRRSRP
ncbi:SURF1 family protein [Mangrovicella endophytica]|uniref:SURF1 family protein n=1 Tax=Mangrovicella endophytica TaxID=2066697 RepID=UPI001FDF6E23|nr:SURF1 family protein [Mangrovicella endophytica]